MKKNDNMTQADFCESSQFDFFKKKSHKIKEDNLKRDGFAYLAVAIWILYGVVTFQLLPKNNTLHQESHVIASEMTSISLPTKSVQIKLDLIDRITNLNSLLAARPMKEISVKEISEDLEIVVDEAKTKERQMLIKGHMPGTGDKVMLEIQSKEVLITWSDITQDEADDFAKFWPVDIADKVTPLKDVKVNIALAPMALPQTQEINKDKSIDSLKEQVSLLQEENDRLKKERAQNVVTKALDDNPHLKAQEQNIRNYVDSLMQLKKNMSKTD